MQILEVIVVIAILVVVGIVIVSILRSTTRIVSQEKRLVVYRLGRFHRIAGPGMVQVIPGLDKVVKTIEIRERPVEVTVSGIIAYAVYNDLILNLWYRVDPVQAAGGDKEKLARLIQLSESERERQVQVKMREALANQVAILQREKPLPPNANTFLRLMALTPGNDHFNALRDGVKQELEKSLPTVGVILNTDQPIVLTGRNISHKIIEAIDREQGRDIDSRWLTKYVGELRKEFPDMSNTVLAQILASVEGVDVGKIQGLLFEKESNMETEVEFEMTSNENGQPNVITKPKPVKPRSTMSGASFQAPPRLTKRDLSILKRVPRADKDEELSA